MARNLVSQVELTFIGDVVSVSGNRLQNIKRVARLREALDNLVHNFEGGIFSGRITGGIESEERGDFGY